MLPETWAQLAILLAAVVPGFVYLFSRRQVAGPDPEVKTFDERILHSVVATGVFAGAYAVAFGPAILGYVRSPERALDDIQAIGLYFVGFAIVLPWVTARVVFFVTAARWFARASGRVVKTLHLPRRSWDPTPSAWDFAFSRGTAGWIRVRFPDGTWLGGWFGDKSFASSYPDPQELYVEAGYVIDANGAFTDIEHAPGGMVIRCADAIAVDFIPVEPDTDEQEVQA